MIQVSRRALLTAMPAAAALPMLGCASVFGSLPQFAADIQTIAADLAKALPDLTTLAGVGGATVTKVEGWISDIQGVAGTIGSAVAAGGSTLVGAISQFGGAFNSITSALGVSVPGTLGTVLQAGLSLLPQILAIAGIALAQVSGPPMMPPARARAILEAIKAS